MLHLGGKPLSARLLVSTVGFLILLLFSPSRVAATDPMTKRPFDLAAGEATQTLKLFASQAQREMMFPTEALAGVTTNAVKGVLTPRDALDRLIARTGLIVVEESNTGALLVNRAPSPDPATEPHPETLSLEPPKQPMNLNPKTSPNPLARLGRWFALALVPLAQGAPDAATPKATPDEPITLSEFTVAATNDNGYMPAESTSGSRVAVKIKDLPYAVNVVTSEFLQDFNIFDITEELAFVSSVNGLDQGGNFNVRGFGGNITLRNGFSRLGNFDRTSADRIEFIKGPAAAVYGQTAPGGIINIISKQPRSTPSQSVMFATGAYNTAREEISATGPIPFGQGAPKLFYAINGSYFHRSYESPAQATRTRSAFMGLTYKFSATTTLSFDFDYNWQHNDTVTLPEISVPANPATSKFVGLATDIVHSYFANPTDWNERAVFNYEAFFEHRFNSVFSMRSAAAIYRSPRFSYSSGGLSAFNPLTRTLTRSQKPTFGFLQGDGQSGAVDFVASYKVAKTTDKTLLTIDYFNNVGKRPAYTAKNNLGAATANVDNPAVIPYLDFNTTDYAPNRFAWDYARTLGTFLRHQIWAFDDRFVAVAGVRYDNVTLFKHDDLAVYPATSPRAGQHVDDAKISGIHNFSTMAGFNYYITKDVIFYASRSESFVPAQPSGLDLTKNPVPIVPNQTGLGYETGFKFDAMNHRFSLTTDVFDIGLKNLQVTEIDPANPANTITTFDGGQKSRGLEVDGNWQVTDKFSWLLAYSYTHSRPTDRGVDLDLMSRQFVKIPYHQLGSAANYQFKNGLRLYVSMRYLSSAFVDTGGGITNATTKLVDSNNGQRLIKSPSYAVWNLGAAYKFKTADRLACTLNLTVKNVFDRAYVQPNRNVGDRLGAYASYTIQH